MRILHWIITTDCQLECLYCPYVTGKYKKSDKVISLDDCKRVIPVLAKHIDEIVFTGGEPFLYSNIFKLIDIANDFNIETSIITNGLLLDDKTIDQIESSNIKRISISLDSTNEFINDSIRSPKNTQYIGEYGRIIKKNITNLSKRCARKISIEILQTITPNTVSSIDRLVDFSDFLGIGIFLHPVGLEKYETIEDNYRIEYIKDNDKVALKEKMMAWASPRNYGSYVRSCFKLLNGEEIKTKKCMASKTRFVLDQNWNLFPCFQHFDMLIGNLLYDDVDSIFDEMNPIIKRYNQLLDNAPCVSIRCICLVST